ncbi:MAG: phosphoglycerate mutase [Nocardioides sp.]|nr:phosphoglycerate mutase [Nocardioides sp.]
MGVLLLVRHGQASFGSDDYDVLSDTGWEQGRALGRAFAAAGVVPTAIVRGSMRRHRETLEAVAETAGWSLDGSGEDLEPAVDAGWDEFDHVGLVGSDPRAAEVMGDRKAFQALFEDVTDRWMRGELDGPEPWSTFVSRVHGSLGAATALAGSGATVVVVTSGGPIGIAAAGMVDPAAASGTTYDPGAVARLWPSFNTVTVNAAVTRVVVGRSAPRLLSFNDHTHLPEALRTYR